MTVLSRAIISTIRQKGKSGLLFLLIFIIVNVILCSLTINKEMSSLRIQALSSISPIISIDLAMDKQQIPEQRQELPLAEIISLGNDPRVKYYDYTNELFVTADNFSAYEIEKSGRQMRTTIKLSGVNYPQLMDIEQNVIRLKQGRTFTKSEINNGSSVVIINNKVAETNNLKIGDTISVKNGTEKATSEKKISQEKIEYTGVRDVVLEIIGIIEHKNESLPGKMDQQKQVIDEIDASKINKMYVPHKKIVEEQIFIEQLLEAEGIMDGKKQLYSPIYVLHNIADVADFKQKVTEKISPSYQTISTLDSYDHFAGGFNTLEQMSTYVLYGTISSFILLFSLMLLLFLRDRKYEIGVYLSLGARKSSVICQIIVEVMLVTLISLSASLVSASLVSVKIAEKVITTTLTNSSENMGIYSGNELDSLNYSEDFSQLKSNPTTTNQLDIPTIIVIYATAIVIVILASSGPLVLIIRTNPKNIML
ncbi:MAG: FtsX-like permease family protein [Culicoidibacterales bacterium]